jgi:hypothetical protein
MIEHDHPGVIAPPPLVYLAGIAVGYGIGRLAPTPMAPGVRAVGWVLFAAAMVLGGWGSFTMSRVGTNIDPREPATTVVQSGPYRYTRNPLYLYPPSYRRAWDSSSRTSLSGSRWRSSSSSSGTGSSPGRRATSSESSAPSTGSTARASAAGSEHTGVRCASLCRTEAPLPG